MSLPRGAWVGLAVALLAALGLMTLAARRHAGERPPPQAAPGSPNIVVIETDDQELASMRVMANVRRLLAAQGTTFDNSFASFPLCCPSRATFLTGQYAHNHRVLANRPPKGGFAKLDHANTLAVWLRRAGYYTALVGKYLNGYGERDPREVPPGWSDWNGSIDPSTYHYYRTTINHNGRTFTTGTTPASYQTDVYARTVTSIIRRRAPASQPFFIWMTPLAPHSEEQEGQGDETLALPVAAPRHRGRFSSLPLPSPPSLNEPDMSDKPAGTRGKPRLTAAQLAALRKGYQRRLGSLLAVDEAVARIVATLRSTGELERTLIIFTSDNGYLLGEHRTFGKKRLYEPSVRVPLIMRGPGVPRGVRRRQLVANVDLAPTILAAARARPGLVMDGIPLLALARNPARGLGRDILLENAKGGGSKGAVAIRTPNYVYTEYGNGDAELYDLRRDPFQLDSRASDPAYASLRASLKTRLAALRACRGRGCSGLPALPRR